MGTSRSATPAWGSPASGVTVLLAGIGGPRPHVEQPWLSWAVAGKVALEAAQAAKLTVHQWTKHRAVGSWCLVAAGASFAAVPAVLPELRAWIASRR